MSNSYNFSNSWKQLERILPKNYKFNEKYAPTEEVWNWNNNKIHIDTFKNPNALAKIIVFHGVGTNGRQLSMVAGGPLFLEGFETIMPDMPPYGMSLINQKEVIKYDDWVQAGVDLINKEQKKDNRPIFLFGLSAGGMETYHVAAKHKGVKGIIGMTFLDQRIQKIRDNTARNKFMSRVGIPSAGLMTKIGLGKFKIPMALASKMSALCNNKQAMSIFMKDITSAGNKASMAFLDSYGKYKPEIEPEDFSVCPVLLVQPEKDAWTPLELSIPTLDKIKKVFVEIKILENGGHYPVEQPALDQLHKYTSEFIKKNLK